MAPASTSGAPPQSAREKAKSVGHYILGKTIGEGTFGKVKRGTHILTGEIVAVKVLEKNRLVEPADAERAAREVRILKLVRHPHVIQLYEIIETRRQLYLIMEYASGGELFDHIVTARRVREPEAARFFHQIISGVERCHEEGVVHRDLKPENLLLDSHKNVKIADFGLSNTFQEGQLLKTACGSPCYASPEMVAGHRYHPPASDLWSCGVILFALVAGYLPFEDPNTASLYNKIMAADYHAPKFVSESVKALIAGLLTTDPSKRFMVEDVRAHPWYRQVPEASLQSPAMLNTFDEEVLVEIDALGFPRDYTVRCLEQHKHNQVTTTYHLLAGKRRKMQERVERFMPDPGSVGNARSGFGADAILGSPDIAGDRLRMDHTPPPAHRGVRSPEPTDPMTTFGAFDARESPRDGLGVHMAAANARNALGPAASPGPATPRSHQPSGSVTPPLAPNLSWSVRRDQTPPGRPSQLPRPATPALELPAALLQAVQTPRDQADSLMHTPREVQATPRGEVTPRDGASQTASREGTTPRDHRPPSGMEGRRPDSGNSSSGIRCPSSGPPPQSNSRRPSLPTTPRLVTDAAAGCQDAPGRVGSWTAAAPRSASACSAASARTGTPTTGRTATARTSADNVPPEISHLATESSRRRIDAQRSPAPQSARARVGGAPVTPRAPLSARAGGTTPPAAPLSARTSLISNEGQGSVRNRWPPTPTTPPTAPLSARTAPVSNEGRGSVRNRWPPTSAWNAPMARPPSASGIRPGRLPRGNR